MEPVRLQKFLAAAGVCSRRKAEDLIRQGRVAVNGEIVTELGTRVRPGTHHVTVDGRPVKGGQPMVYIMLNKPVGVVSSCSHPGQRTVMDLVRVRERIYPVGRLDKDSRGLLLLTSDGSLHHRLLHPSFDHEKEYEVEVDGYISDGALRRLAGGVLLKGRKTRPAEVVRLSGRRFRIVLKEGRNRQVRRMVGKVGRRVIDLKRVRMAGIRLGSLPEGSWRHLSPHEREMLLKGMDADHAV
jgi:23S rRNA pseudouridine2605 synthase/23S rRNA pseudouridine2604 synthase